MGQLVDLDKAVELHREALRLRPTAHPDRPASLNSLASVLAKRFDSMGLSDLEEVIMTFRTAFDMLNREHPQFCTISINLETILMKMFWETGYLDDAMTIFVL